ncbi:ACP S-malonyltransferase [Aliibacillus thermotolerans]|uniref:Malonyl CoA-acyl carrier protein transacylase n=1 Tax=Aliibacillus thermotolerans TaxID=1834418 RepID=A0ABW0U5Z2_9BACI|nr:ACP S-malonyltransferase [Aliibacillus thermotolerans]MDA3130650.1 ACP S-malonyltransferase [Aliibacillus thermotolerans]
MGKTAFLFPGQGSQYVGMGKEIYDQTIEAKEVIDQVDDTLDYGLSRLMFEGPLEELTRTEHAQPALLTVSVAVLQLLHKEGIRADYAAGHSLGEYSALVAADVLSLKEAVKLVKKRGLLMEEAVPTGVGTMAAVMGLEREKLSEVTEEVSDTTGTVELANINAPGQIVISGKKEAVEKVGELAREKGAKRVIPLSVSGPFHSSLMQPAQEQLQEEINALSFSDATVPVIQNVNATEATDKDIIKKQLIKQVTAPVYWEDTIRRLLDLGVTRFIEVGPGKVLSGLVRRVQRRGVEVYAVENIESIQALLKE